MALPRQIKTITAYHRLRGLPKPKHPLISVIRFDGEFQTLGTGTHKFLFDFYMISLKHGMNAKYRYGQTSYDFDEGVMFFIKPGQVFGIEVDGEYQRPSGWMLLIHPDFLWSTHVAKSIRKYEFFDYSINEALFLSEEEEIKMHQIIRDIEQEYHKTIDRFSQRIIISQLETLLNYSDRFYDRQFITRQKSSHQILEKLDTILEDFINKGKLISDGLPTAQSVSDKLNISSNYLRKLLKEYTGKNTRQLIHEKLIEKAKEKLSTTRLSVSEIAYELGFEHPQSFNKLFKAKTNQSPLEFRKSFH
jgi:AraC family transcriptional activator of pobA